MQIEVADIQRGNGTFSHDYQPNELIIEDSRIRLASTLSITGTLKRENQKLRVMGQLKTLLHVECDRCLELVELPIDAGFNVEYVTPEQYESAQTAELAEEDLALSIFDGEVIDIDQLALEQLLLATPSHVLCTDDCKGLCAECGTNLNSGQCDCAANQVDPRWAALKQFKGDKS